ncbi:MAG: dUTP diphosphatase [Bacteroidetes bacterium]|nr:dUTP diphosphatase [Bacteroidota bacterium]
MIPVRIVNQSGHALPAYQTTGAAGQDVCAWLPDGPITLAPGDWVAVPTGLYLEIPEGYEMQVRPRSGLAAKHAVTILNGPGTIDSDYRGELRVLMINHGREPFRIESGMRIAQLVLAIYGKIDWLPVDSLSESERGTGGFGHTGLTS